MLAYVLITFNLRVLVNYCVKEYLIFVNAYGTNY